MEAIRRLTLRESERYSETLLINIRPIWISVTISAALVAPIFKGANRFMHEDSPNTGAHLMSQEVSFATMKLTNDTTSRDKRASKIIAKSKVSCADVITTLLPTTRRWCCVQCTAMSRISWCDSSITSRRTKCSPSLIQSSLLSQPTRTRRYVCKCFGYYFDLYSRYHYYYYR